MIKISVAGQVYTYDPEEKEYTLPQNKRGMSKLIYELFKHVHELEAELEGLKKQEPVCLDRGHRNWKRKTGEECTCRKYVKYIQPVQPAAPKEK